MRGSLIEKCVGIDPILCEAMVDEDVADGVHHGRGTTTT